MYPFFRLARELWAVRKAPPLPVLGCHVSRHRCWPWDLDPWIELNNGRTLTLYDLGRIPLGRRTGMYRAAAAQGWGATVAGVMVRYRRRIRAFDVVEMRSRCIGWDARFFYIEQSIWLGDECANHMVLRSAIASPAGIVPPARLLAVMGEGAESPPLPDWVEQWIAAEAVRPWPPER